MLPYLGQRLLQSVFVLLGVTLVTFLLVFLLPADPARMIAGRSATVQTVDSIRHELGLDRPLHVQFVSYVKGLLRGDLGRSYAQRAAVSDLIASRFMPTLQLAGAGILFELLIGLPAGIMAALRRGTRFDQFVMALAFVGVSAPQFVVGLILIYILAYLIPVFPLGGYGTPLHVVLPAVAVGLAGGGWYARVTRSAAVVAGRAPAEQERSDARKDDERCKQRRDGHASARVVGPDDEPRRVHPAMISGCCGSRHSIWCSW